MRTPQTPLTPGPRDETITPRWRVSASKPRSADHDGPGRFSECRIIDITESATPVCTHKPRRVALVALVASLLLSPAVSAASLGSYVGQGNTFNTDGANWCADFAVQVTGDALPVEPSRSAKQLYNRFKAAGLLTTSPQPGDLIFFWRESPTSWKGHVGIVESVTADTLTTVEGNVSHRVQRRTYPRQAIPRLLGFGKVRP